MTTEGPADTTYVIDAGARYGIHPSWADYQAPLQYHMFEADPEESARLAEKYVLRNGSLHVHPLALGEAEGRMTLNILRHRGQSTRLQPNPGSVWFGKSRTGEGEVVGRYEADMTTVDIFAAELGVDFDFLKSDTEGSELSILTGAAQQLAGSILGVNAEVQFAEIYDGAPMFGDLHSFLQSSGFALLNLETCNLGSPVNSFYKSDWFGFLEAGEATWIKPFDRVVGLADSELSVCASARKLSAFCFNQGATDVAVQFMLDAARRFPDQWKVGEETALSRYLDTLIQSLFKELGSHLAYDQDELDAVYWEIFHKKRKKRHEFYEDPELNP